MCSPDSVQAHNNSLNNLAPIEHTNLPFISIPPPLDDSAKCSLTLIRPGDLLSVHAEIFLQGEEPNTRICIPSYAFLIEKQVDGKLTRLLYEMGLRNPNDHVNPYFKNLDDIWKVQVKTGVASILQSNNVPLTSISHFIIGHAHFDHIGNLADLPKSVKVIVGPDSPIGEHLADELDVAKEEILERVVRALSRDKDKWEDVGTFRGLDYFGDGSFWILDVPGHKPGHIAGLVRTHTNPPVYHILGSDTAHSIDLLNSPNTPSARIAFFPPSLMSPPGTIDTSLPEKLTSMHANVQEAYVSMAKMRRMDIEENVNVCLAHDNTMERVVPKGEFVKFQGTLEELERFKRRSRVRYNEYLRQ